MYDNDFRKEQAAKILAVYGGLVNVAEQPIVKSEDTTEVENKDENNAISEVDIKKSEAYSLISSLANGDNIVKSSDNIDAKLEEQTEESKETAPNDLQEDKDETEVISKEKEVKKSEDVFEGTHARAHTAYGVNSFVKSQQTRILSCYNIPTDNENIEQ